MTAHNLFSPSSAAIWTKCLQSKLLASTHETIKPSQQAAREGTKLHDIFCRKLYEKLRWGFPDVKIIAPPEAQKTWVGELDKGVEQKLDYAVNYVTNTIRKQAITTVALEMQLPVMIASPHGNKRSEHEGNYFDVGGTADILMFNDEKMWVWDLKTGYIKIDAKNNLQLSLYMIGALLKFQWLEPKYLSLGILQPKLNHYSFYDTDVKDKFIVLHDQIKEQLKVYDTEFHAGPHCKYCPSKSVCPLMHQAIDAAKKYPLISEKESINLLTLSDGLSRLLVELNQSFASRMIFGEKIEGLKLVSELKYGKMQYKVVKDGR
jgi:hypothetical protein